MSRARSRCRLRVYSLLLAGLAALLLPLGSPLSPELQAQAPGTAPAAPGAGPANPGTAHPLDEPLAWLVEGRSRNQGFRDYTCTFIKEERIGGQLQPQNVMLMKFRAQPFSVNMRWLAPSKLVNQEVSYIEGRNRNQMRVHSNALLGVTKFVSIDLKDRRVMQNSRHSIDEAGIGKLLERTYQGWLRDRSNPQVQARTAEYKYSERLCLRVEVIRPQRDTGSYCYRSVTYIDKELKLPIRSENYDWPRQGGPPEGDKLEEFSYVNLQFNVNLTEADFVR